MFLRHPHISISLSLHSLSTPHLENMDLIDDRAVLDDEDDEESVDEETGDVRQKSNGAKGRFEDSSEEDDDDDDEEAAAEVYFTPRLIPPNLDIDSDPL